jgi:hypothetical protein
MLMKLLSLGFILKKSFSLYFFGCQLLRDYRFNKYIKDINNI